MVLCMIFQLAIVQWKKKAFLIFTNISRLKIISNNAWSTKKIFIILLASVVNVFSHTKYVSLSNQKCTTHPTFINLHPNEYTQGLCYYAFAVNLDMCVGSCNTLNDLSNKVCVSNKIEDLNLIILSMITRINESKKYVMQM